MIILLALAAITDLDKPVIPKQPTVRSEIQRGFDAALDCSLKFPPVEADQEFKECIDDAASANRQQMGSAYEAFDVGLYYWAMERTQGTTAYEVEEAGYNNSKNELGLTDAQVQVALKKK